MLHRDQPRVMFLLRHSGRVFGRLLIAVGLIYGLPDICRPLGCHAASVKGDDPYEDVIVAHPRIFITKKNRVYLKNKAQRRLSDAYDRLLIVRNRRGRIKEVKHSNVPRKLEDLRDYIYKYGYLYQMTGDVKWAQYAVSAMEQVPQSIKAYGGAHKGYALAIEGLGIGFDWCYDKIVEAGKKRYFIDLISGYYAGNLKNLHASADFHNYAAQAEFAMLVAGLATYGDNGDAPSYLRAVQNVMETGEIINGVLWNVKESVAWVEGACNWEGVTYTRKPLFSYIKYAEAWRTATDGKIDPWKDAFSLLENAGYYILYSLRPDNLFENIGDVNYRALSYHDMNNLAALQTTFKNPHFTAFLNRYYRWSDGKFRTDIWLGRLKAPLIFYLMWYDPDLPEADLEGLPLSRRFGDVIIIRTGFGRDDLFVSFKSGIHWGFHSQLDHGSFTIFKHSPLAIDSGYYDNWKWGKRHNWNYWKRTIAHNTLLIHNPVERSLRYPRKNKRLLKNDGGQRFAFMRFSPPHKLSGSSNGVKSIQDLKDRFEEFSMGKITGFEVSRNFVYIRADLTNAYNNKYCSLGTNQPCRVRFVERQFVYLRPGIIVVFDRTDSLKSEFVKKWLLHSGSYYDKSGRPEVNGSLSCVQGTEAAGISESLDSDVATIVRGDGRLTIKTVLPDKHVTRIVGGEGYEFWVCGENQGIAGKGIPKARRDEDPGAWRIEIEPLCQQKYDEFLNVLYPCHSSTTSTPSVVKIGNASRAMTGIHITDHGKDWIVVFCGLEERPSGIYEYTAHSLSTCRHILLNLKPNVFHEIRKAESKHTCKISVRESRHQSGMLSSSGGVISFRTDH